MRFALAACLLLGACGREQVRSDVVLVCGDCPGDSGAHGDCVPACVGQCSGFDDGCGDTCDTNDCAGCCTDSAECLVATEPDEACGAGGAACVDCIASSQVCDLTSRTCFDPCLNIPSDDCESARLEEQRCGGDHCAGGVECVQTCSQLSTCYRWLTTDECNDGTCIAGECCYPDCVGKCEGAVDRCGGVCPTNECLGCCDSASACVALTSQSNGQCGAQGETCSNCSAAFGICLDNQCCTPMCEGRCPGAADGCGGTCQSNDCGGCCTTDHSCVLPASQADALCGSSGASCANCVTAGGVCHQNQCCVPECSGACPGASDSCGGTCAGNDCNGCCAGSTCISSGGISDEACGDSGEDCHDCSASSEVCFENACCAPDCTGMCLGADDGCGGTCSFVSCSGCCSSQRVCIATSSQAASICGHGGQSCRDCGSGRDCFGGYCCVSNYGQSCTTTCHELAPTVRGYSQYEDSWCSGSNESVYSITNCSAVDPDPCATYGVPSPCGLTPGYSWCDVICNYYSECTLSYGCNGTCG